jgi:hypothetical protein
MIPPSAFFPLPYRDGVAFGLRRRTDAERSVKRVVDARVTCTTLGVDMAL